MNSKGQILAALVCAVDAVFALIATFCLIRPAGCKSAIVSKKRARAAQIGLALLAVGNVPARADKAVTAVAESFNGTVLYLCVPKYPG